MFRNGEMNFQINDRVCSLFNDFPGLRKGEYGTVVRISDYGDPIIHWDEFNEHRHNADGDTPQGHGWFINKSEIKFAEPNDLGELPGNEDGIGLLFCGGDL